MSAWLGALWASTTWREIFRLAHRAQDAIAPTEKGLPFDIFGAVDVVAVEDGEAFGSPWIVALMMEDRTTAGQSFAFISCRYECTIGNGAGDFWEEDFAKVTVQTAANLDDLKRWAMGAEDRARLDMLLLEESPAPEAT